MIMSHDNYDILANNHLNNNDTYCMLENDQTSDIIDRINTKLKQLLKRSHISKQLFNYLKISDLKNTKAGKFKILAKIHKEKFGIRPIINCIGHPTEFLCKFIDMFLQPIVKSKNTILKDSQHLLQDLNDIKFYNKQYLYSCDFESLYTNMNPRHTIDSISAYLLKNTNMFETDLLDITGFRTILDLIFTMNIFRYKDKFYLQQIGIPMGCKCGPSLANMYLYTLENEFIHRNPQMLYYRFIDDIFISSHVPLNKKDLCDQFPNLTLNIVEGAKVNFLDLDINYDDSSGMMNFSLYIKPTNTFSYLLTTSNHPKQIFKNIPLSLFIRIRRICSNYLDYLYFSSLLIIQLCKRGYDIDVVSKIAKQVGDNDRNKLLPYKKRPNKDRNENMFFFFKFNSFCKELKRHLVSAFENTRNDNRCMMNNKLFVVNKIDTNIGSLLIHNAKLPDYDKKYKYTKCKKSNCKICKYSTNNYYLKDKQFILPIMSHSNCNSEEIVYIIKCNRCSVYYIGESKRKCKVRINEHLNNIKRFQKNLSITLSKLDSTTETAKHFNTNGHDFEMDFKFYIFKKNLNDSERFSTETDLINLFLKLKIPILNEKINNMYNLKSLSFA